MNPILRPFLNEDRGLRFFWRAAIFFALVTFGLPALTGPLFLKAFNALQLKADLNAQAIAFEEGMNLVFALVCTGIFALAERRGIGSYGLPIARALKWETFEGFIAGLVLAGAVAIGMILLGGMQVKGLALTGGALAASGLAWLGANILIGLAEELWFRAYFLRALWRSIGFWPAAIVIALVFAAMHYFFKEGENVWDVITLIGVSLVLCFTVIRTGTLWFAVGFHIAYDFMQFFVIGTRNGGLTPVGRMFDVTFNGPAWVNGGALGTEASFLMYPALIALWLYVWARYPRAAQPMTA
ncbi:MAG TPA: CPBP family intramembrane glutamic endopeptidase [Rhizomicrobium sp.]|jgi:membrane protease YdiL (CAAX protease family)|nr:CPBP family intramembrane glutamic endopeptidase [Rhizomicrobium sp.]